MKMFHVRNLTETSIKHKTTHGAQRSQMCSNDRCTLFFFFFFFNKNVDFFD